MRKRRTPRRLSRASGASSTRLQKSAEPDQDFRADQREQDRSDESGRLDADEAEQEAAHDTAGDTEQDVHQESVPRPSGDLPGEETRDETYQDGDDHGAN